MVFIRADRIGLEYPVPKDVTLKVAGAGAVGGRLGVSGRGRRHVTALDGISFELKSGDRLGLIGPNGAGKTTLLKVLYGIYEPTSGTLSKQGRIDALFNIGLGFRPEATGRRNIVLRGLINGWTPEQISHRMEDIVAFSELGDFIDMPLKTYSQGMSARLAFAIATSFHPEILLMDEWVGAGDGQFRLRARERLESMLGKAGIVVLASHDDTLIRRICNKVMKMESGKAISVEAIEDEF